MHASLHPLSSNTAAALDAPPLPRRGVVSTMVRALRPYQWVKNILVFVPLVTSHTLLQTDLLRRSALTFIAFSLCASAIYVLNDLNDLHADRQHPRKRLRPLASGELSVRTGILLITLLLPASLAIALVGVSAQVAGVLALYVAITTAYTWRLKREPVTDVFVLAALYVVRVVAGGVATEIQLSAWLLAFAVFIFLSLAYVKRYIELTTRSGHMPGRGYRADDGLWMHAVGTSSGYMAVLVLALYVNSSEVTALYQRPTILLLLCPMLLFWITRLWFRAGRRQLHDDPVIEALKDPGSYILATAAAAVLLAAL